MDVAAATTTEAVNDDFTGNVIAAYNVVRPRFRFVSGIGELASAWMWRAAAMELLATFLVEFIYVCAFNVVELANGALLSGLIFALVSALVTYTFAPETGGHFNPFVTMATMTTGHTPLARGVVYILFQTGGACLAALCMGKMFKDELDYRKCQTGTGNNPTSVTIGVSIIMNLLFLFIFYAFTFDKAPTIHVFSSHTPIGIGVLYGIMLVVSYIFEAANDTIYFPNPSLCTASNVAAAAGNVDDNDILTTNDGDNNSQAIGVGMSWFCAFAASIMFAVFYYTKPVAKVKAKDDTVSMLAEVDVEQVEGGM